MSFFEVQHLTAGYGEKTILNDISFSIPYESVYLFEGDTERVINA